MDHERFGALTKGFANGPSRRSMMALGGLAAGAFAAAFRQDAPEAEAAFCRFPGQECGKNRQCCAHKCTGGVCGCKPKGATCYNNFGLSCCSKECRRGTCR